MSKLEPPALIRALLAALATVIVAGCGSGAGSSDEPPPDNRWNEMQWDQGQWG